MFLGYALLNLPHFFITVGESIKRGFRDIRVSTLIRAKNHTTNNLEDVSEPFVTIENWNGNDVLTNEFQFSFMVLDYPALYFF